MSSKTVSNSDSKNPQIEAMFKVGAHFGFVKTRRHPSVKPYIFGVKNRVEIFDLEKTEEALKRALDFVKEVAASGKQILFVGSKSEAKEVVKRMAERAGQPYVNTRWVGGTFTNFETIKKRVEKMLDLISKKERGELNKYTKKERLMMDREVERLNSLFAGITGMTNLPAAIFVVDPKKEHIAVAEARLRKIPVIALLGSDCDLNLVNYPIPANDAAIQSIEYFAQAVSDAYAEAKKLV